MKTEQISKIYTYNKDDMPVSFVPSNQRDCYYQGYVDGHADSIVMLSSCSGLSGLIQIQNTSYGIEPIESASGFHHLVFRIDYNDTGLQFSKQNYSIKWTPTVISKKDPAQPINFAILKYVEMHVVVAKSLYDYMGSNEDVVTGKIMQLMNFINTMFYKLNMKLILSSLELWINKDKIPITGNADVLLQQFLNWKNEHLTLRPHDMAFLFFQNGMTLEAFSVIVAQLLGFSVGLYFDDTRECHCSGTNFLNTAWSQCLQNKPRFNISYRAPLCGNHMVEEGEQCDCGTVKLKARGALCRDLEDPDCDLKEFCNGSSAECSENHYVEDGHWCERRTGVCMKGRCQSADRWCQKIFGAHLRCGKLVCDYPNKVPFFLENAAIIYAKVQNRLCVTLDYLKGPGIRDPFLIHDGTVCGENK
ncbi:hypothetical protein E2320_006899, partial [Naja naja]